RPARLKTWEEPRGQLQVHSAGQIQIELPLAGKAGVAVKTEIRIRTAQRSLVNPDFTSTVRKAKGSPVFQRHGFISERDMRNVGLHDDAVRLAQRSRKREAAVHAAVAGELAEMQASLDKGIEVDLFEIDLAGKRAVSCEAKF